MKRSSLRAVLVLLALAIPACENYSTPYLDEQGRLNDQLSRGEITQAQYDQAIRRQREKPWGATGEQPPQRYQQQW
jgi:hypothetical protein